MFTMRTSYPLTLLIFTVLVWPVVIGAQVKPQRKAFVINGQSGDATVVQVNGREYIDIEALVRITNGSMGFRNGNTALTLLASAAEGTSSSPDPNGRHRRNRAAQRVGKPPCCSHSKRVPGLGVGVSREGCQWPQIGLCCSLHGCGPERICFAQ
jgi:hypothetical protein